MALRCQIKRYALMNLHRLAPSLCFFVVDGAFACRLVNRRRVQPILYSGCGTPSRFHIALVIRCWLA